MKLYKDYDWLYRKRVSEGLSLRQIAAEAGCSHKTILRHLRQSNIVSPERDEAMKKFIDEMLKICEEFEGKLSKKERREWIRVYTSMWTQIEKAKAEKLLKKQEAAGRVLGNRQTHPMDDVKCGLGKKYDSQRFTSYSFAEEMELIQEIHDKIG